MNPPRVFDTKHYERLNTARAAAVTQLLRELKEKLELRTAIDVGCGLGYFSGLLDSLGFEVLGVDGRQENVEEAQRRFPNIKFQQCDAQDSALTAFGRFDLVFCFGLLYHLESPLITIRHLHAMTGRLLLVEAVIYPGTDPLMALIEEEIHEDQGLRHIAFYPTEACLVKMLYRAGFLNVYGFKVQPAHPEYLTKRYSRRVRTMLAASPAPLQSQLVFHVPELSSPIRPWDPRSGVKTGAIYKLRSFTRKPLPEKIEAFKKVMKGKASKKR